MEIVVPELGESIVDATVAQWLKKEGDTVSAGEALVSLETDKVDLEVSAGEDGILARIDHQEGEDVKVGQVLGMIQPSGVAKPAAPAGSSVEQGMPQPATEVTESSAPQAAQSQAAEPAQASKSAATGQLESDTEVPVQTPASSSAPAAAQPPPGSSREPVRTNGSPNDRITPVARRFAEEHDLDLSQVPAPAPGQRLTKEDLQRYLESRQAEPAPAAPSQVSPPSPAPSQAPTASSQPPTLPSRSEERIRMTRRRRTIAARLVEVQQTAAMLTTFNDVDMRAVIEIRNRRKESFLERNGVKLGFMSFFVKAAIGALKAFPLLNAEIQGDEFVIKHYYDIGIAIGASEGLVVPVLRNADKLSFAAIEKAIKKFGKQAEEGSLSLEDLRGGTFSITNGGVYGSLLSTPILNPPQVGILGMHRIEERPVAKNGELVVRPMMYLALSYDHRIVDGREAVQFLVRLKELIEDPETLLLEG